MNSITVAGNISQDAEVKFMSNGDPVASFSVADNQGKDKQAIFWRCSLFGKRAESLSQYLTKGQAVTVSGTVTEREYEKDGQKRKAMDIRVNDVALQGGKPSGAAPAAPKPAARQQKAEPDFIDDVPF